MKDLDAEDGPLPETDQQLAFNLKDDASVISDFSGDVPRWIFKAVCPNCNCSFAVKGRYWKAKKATRDE